MKNLSLKKSLSLTLAILSASGSLNAYAAEPNHNPRFQLPAANRNQRNQQAQLVLNLNDLPQNVEDAINQEVAPQVGNHIMNDVDLQQELRRAIAERAQRRQDPEVQERLARMENEREQRVRDIIENDARIRAEEELEINRDFENRSQIVQRMHNFMAYDAVLPVLANMRNRLNELINVMTDILEPMLVAVGNELNMPQVVGIDYANANRDILIMQRRFIEVFMLERRLNDPQNIGLATQLRNQLGKSFSSKVKAISTRISMLRKSFNFLRNGGPSVDREIYDYLSDIVMTQVAGVRQNLDYIRTHRVVDRDYWLACLHLLGDMQELNLRILNVQEMINNHINNQMNNPANGPMNNN